MNGGASTYGYALQSPIGNYDPDGLFSRIACANPHNWASCDAAGLSTPLNADYSCGAALVAGVGAIIAEEAIGLLPVGKAGELAGAAFKKAKGVIGKAAKKVTKKGFPKDFSTKDTINRSAKYASERDARNLARTKIGKDPVQVEPNKLRSQDGKWQYRGKPEDLTGHGPKDSPHIHLERLNPKTGEVLENWHLRW